MNGTNETEAGIETDLTHARVTTLGSTRNIDKLSSEWDRGPPTRLNV